MKTILDMGHNYRLIEEAIEGLGYLKESPAMRATRRFRISEGEGLDYQFMNKILGFIDSDLESTLQYLILRMEANDWMHCRVEAVGIPKQRNDQEKGYFQFKAYRDDSEKLRFTFNDIRAGEPKEREHRIHFDIEIRSDDSLAFSTNNDLDSWWGWREVDQKRLGAQVADKLQSIFHRNKGKNITDFAAWINIEAHPSLQIGIAKQPNTLRDFLARVIPAADFPVLICVYGGFKLTEPLLFGFGSVAGFPEMNAFQKPGRRCYDLFW